MSPEYLITLLNARLATLINAKSAAEASGDIENVLKLELEITGTQDTIQKLQ